MERYCQDGAKDVSESRGKSSTVGAESAGFGVLVARLRLSWIDRNGKDVDGNVLNAQKGWTRKSTER